MKIFRLATKITTAFNQLPLHLSPQERQVVHRLKTESQLDLEALFNRGYTNWNPRLKNGDRPRFVLTYNQSPIYFSIRNLANTVNFRLSLIDTESKKEMAHCQFSVSSKGTIRAVYKNRKKISHGISLEEAYDLIPGENYLGKIIPAVSNSEDGSQEGIEVASKLQGLGIAKTLAFSVVFIAVKLFGGERLKFKTRPSTLPFYAKIFGQPKSVIPLHYGSLIWVTYNAEVALGNILGTVS